MKTKYQNICRWKLAGACMLLCLLVITRQSVGQTPPEQADRLGAKMDELMEMLTLSQRFSYTEFLRYHVDASTVDSISPTIVLQHDTGSYKMAEGYFWGTEGNNEFMQGDRYYLEVSHNDQRIFVYDKLKYPRVLQVSLADSLFNQQYLFDLSMLRPGGVLKKLRIYYRPESPFSLTEITYDSTNYDIKTIGYHYKSTHFTDGYETCQHLSTALVASPSGESRPSELPCWSIQRVYENFIAEFPNRTKGATVNMYIAPVAAFANRSFNSMPTAGNGSTSIVGPPPPDTVSKKKTGRAMTLTSTEESSSGRWVDTTLNARELFEWYMNAHLGYNYSGENYIDWLVNDCGKKLYQLPWSDEVYVRADTLQNIWNRFSAAFPASLLTITGTAAVPVVKGLHVASNEPTAYYTDDRLQGMVWTSSGDWFISHTSNVFDVSVLPRTATVNSASMSMWARADPWITAAHYRQETDTAKLRAVQVKGNYLPDVTTYSTEPPLLDGGALYDFHYSTVPISSGWNFWSNENYLGEDVKPLVQGVIHSFDSIGVNYPLQYRIDHEEVVNYKRYVFYGIWDPGGQSIQLEVNYTAPRQEVFAAYVNAALGTYMRFSEIQEMYKLYGSRLINATATTATTGPGCTGESATDYTAIKTIQFTNRNEDAFELTPFAEGRFIGVTDSGFVPTDGYPGYEVINMSSTNFSTIIK